MDELLEKDEQDISKELYDSRLSLISEESEGHEDNNTEETYCITTSDQTHKRVPVVVQESMI